MTGNPLKNAAPSSAHEPWKAMDYVHAARSHGNTKMEALWLAEAKKRGEIPDFSGDRD